MGCVQVKSIDSINTQYHNDSLIAWHNWQPVIGQQQDIKIKVINPCKPGVMPYDAAFTAIECQFIRSGGRQQIVNFADPDPQMELIYFDSSAIWNTNYKNSKAVFIPFSYCGSYDTDLKSSVFIIYNDNAYLAHLYFSCGEGEKAGCSFKNIIIANNKKLPEALQSDLIMKMKQRYGSREKFPG